MSNQSPLQKSNADIQPRKFSIPNPDSLFLQNLLPSTVTASQVVVEHGTVLALRVRHAECEVPAEHPVWVSNTRPKFLGEACVRESNWIPQ